jgi:hypothetical protein
MKNEWNWMVVCQKPLKHNPQFEGRYHCKHCARELGEEE